MVAPFILCLILSVWGTCTLLNYFSTDIRVDEAGSTYASSLGNRWKAEVWDGFCKDNDKQYMVIYVWDLKKYPSMVEEVPIPRAGKKPDVKLVFPKAFNARASTCSVKWASSSIFEIEFACEDGPQVLRYDVSKHTFTFKDKTRQTN
jgi:hypothetical protein